MAEIVAALGLSRRGFDELFTRRRRCAECSFDEVLARTSARVASSYRASARGSRLGRIRTSIQAMLDARDEERRASVARCVLLPAPAPDVRVVLWELPAGEADAPYRHTLSEEELLVVLDGRTTVRTTGHSRDLQGSDVAVLMPLSASEVLNYAGRPTRFLALSCAFGGWMRRGEAR